TSDTAATAARMVHLLRCRWRIENAFKYLAEHHGIDSLCDYTMNVGPDTSLVRNPGRATATATLRSAEAAVAGAERALGQAMARPSSGDDYLGTIRLCRDEVAMAKDDVAEAKAALRGVPAERPANDVKPGAERAVPRAERRSLQMVLRLLAYNAEADLARRLNAYLADPDEYRAITRNLLHQGGRIHFGADAVTVTIDAPNQPRVARALALLADELNQNPAPMLGDRRPVIYRVGAS
ncbi:MAG: putative transposase, partial [Acidimicrobiales bacterium]